MSGRPRAGAGVIPLGRGRAGCSRCHRAFTAPAGGLVQRPGSAAGAPGGPEGRPTPCPRPSARRKWIHPEWSERLRSFRRLSRLTRLRPTWFPTVRWSTRLEARRRWGHQFSPCVSVTGDEDGRTRAAERFAAAGSLARWAWRTRAVLQPVSCAADSGVSPVPRISLSDRNRDESAAGFLIAGLIVAHTAESGLGQSSSDRYPVALALEPVPERGRRTTTTVQLGAATRPRRRSLRSRPRGSSRPRVLRCQPSARV